MTERGAPPCIVAGPGVLARAFLDAPETALLERWRDGALYLAMTRELLAYYLMLLRRLGADEESLRHWAWWFTWEERVRLVEGHAAANSGVVAALADAATRCNAEAVVTRLARPEAAREGNIVWISAEAWLNK